MDKRTDGKQVVTEYHARHILIKVNELTSSDQAKKTIEDIRNRIVNGHEDFATLAKKDSQDPSTASAGASVAVPASSATRSSASWSNPRSWISSTRTRWIAMIFRLALRCRWQRWVAPRRGR